jgi:hypothetical protein
MELEPYLTVGTDDHGNTCWVVVGTGCRVHCATGQRALEILETLARSTGSEPPVM